MKHIRILLLSLASSFGAFAVDINISSGELEGILADESIRRETTLRLKGTIDARDLAAIEKLPASVISLDLSAVKIDGLTTPSRQYFGRTLFKKGEIPAYTFFKSSVESIILPQEVTFIGEGAFAGSDIRSITIPEGVTSISDYAFYGCRNLESVTLPSTLNSIGKGAFGNCSGLRSIDMKATGITVIPERAFAGALTLENIDLPDGVVRIGREAFSHTALHSLSLGKVKVFEEYALSNMPFITELSINPDAIIPEGLLMDDTSLHSLSGVPQLIPDYFAANCTSLDSHTLNSGGTIGKYSFANTFAPEILVITGAIDKIDRGAISGLNGIKQIDVTALGDRVPSVDELTFEGISQPDIVLMVDDAAFDLWEGHPVWSLFQVKSDRRTGIQLPEAEETAASLDIAVRDRMLVVESASKVSDVRIYTSDGRIAFVASPDRETVEIDLSSLPSGVLIVAATDETGASKTVSLLLK